LPVPLKPARLFCGVIVPPFGIDTMPNCRRSMFGSFLSISMMSAGGVPFLISR
jgi:hypothetical protein